MTLGNAHDTVGAYLALTDAGKHANQTYGNADAEAEGAGDGAAGEFTQHHEEGHEAVDTLGGREGGEHHVATGGFRFALECTLGGVTRDGGAIGGADTRQCKDESESEITKNLFHNCNVFIYCFLSGL